MSDMALNLVPDIYVLQLEVCASRYLNIKIEQRDISIK